MNFPKNYCTTIWFLGFVLLHWQMEGLNKGIKAVRRNWLHFQNIWPWGGLRFVRKVMQDLCFLRCGICAFWNIRFVLGIEQDLCEMWCNCKQYDRTEPKSKLAIRRISPPTSTGDPIQLKILFEVSFEQQVFKFWIKMAEASKSLCFVDHKECCKLYSMC